MVELLGWRRMPNSVPRITCAQADVVGRLTQVEGRVDLMKGGQPPATPVKVNEGVQTGDVLRTKSQSKAQITFIDRTTLAIAPESRVAIEAYMFDPAKKKRNAVLQLFRGLAHLVVSKVYKVVKPDFVVKTHTAQNLRPEKEGQGAAAARPRATAPLS
jgi:hypothetical protein